MSADDKIIFGREAKQILASPVVQAAFTDMESRIITEWRESKDRDIREDCYFRIRALDHFRRTIQSTSDSGKMTEHRIKSQ